MYQARRVDGVQPPHGRRAGQAAKVPITARDTTGSAEGGGPRGNGPGQAPDPDHGKQLQVQGGAEGGTKPGAAAATAAAGEVGDGHEERQYVELEPEEAEEGAGAAAVRATVAALRATLRHKYLGSVQIHAYGVWLELGRGRGRAVACRCWLQCGCDGRKVWPPLKHPSKIGRQVMPICCHQRGCLVRVSCHSHRLPAHSL